MNIPLLDSFAKASSSNSASSIAPKTSPQGVSFDTQVVEFLSGGQRGLMKPSMLSFGTLERLSRQLPLVGIIKNTLKHEITKVRWDLVPVSKKVTPNPAHIEEVQRLLRFPNRNKETFRQLFEKVIDDVLVFDAGVIEKLRSREGKIVELWHRPGNTILPVYDEHGVAGDPAYIQVLDPDPEPVASWSNEDMIYMMQNPQGSYKYFGYGLSPVETAAVSITSMLMTETYNSMYFDKNSIPPALISMPGASDEQLKKFRANWIMDLTGVRNSWKVPVVGSQIDLKPLRATNQDMQFMEYNMWLARIIIAAFEMSPQDIGFTFDINKATGETQRDLSKNKGVKSLLNLIREYINNEIIYDFGYENEFTFEWMDVDKNDEEMQANIDKIYTSIGVKTINEVRAKIGEDPVEGGEILRIIAGQNVIEVDATPLEELSTDEIEAARIAEDDDMDEDDDNAVEERELGNNKTDPKDKKPATSDDKVEKPESDSTDTKPAKKK